MRLTPSRDAVKGAILVALIAACARFAWPSLRQLQDSGTLGAFHVQWIVAAAVPVVLHYWVVYRGWILSLHLLGARPDRSTATKAYVLGLLPKYLPGKVAGLGVRGHVVIQGGVHPDAATGSLFLEGALGFASAVAVSAIGLLASPTSELRDASRWLVTAFVAVVGVLGVVSTLPRVGARWKRWTGLGQLASRPSLGLVILLLYMASWLLPACAHWLLARAISPLPGSMLLPLMMALAVAWGVGAISVFAPAGLGVREGVLFLFVRQWMSDPQAILFVTLSRLLSFGVELLLTSAWWLYARGSHRVQTGAA